MSSPFTPVETASEGFLRDPVVKGPVLTWSNTIEGTVPVQGLKGGYWGAEAWERLEKNDWSTGCVADKIDIPAWQKYTKTLLPDPYVDGWWKRASWLSVSPDGGPVYDMGFCPMGQGAKYNLTASMSNVTRSYPPLENAFIARPDVQRFVREWAALYDLAANEPMLMQIMGVRGEGTIDPLKGQGIHSDGYSVLGLMVLSRDNIEGGMSTVYSSLKEDTLIGTETLTPGKIIHIRDDTLYHGVTSVCQADPTKPFERFIVIMTARVLDLFQNQLLRDHFPQAVLGTWARRSWAKVNGASTMLDLLKKVKQVAKDTSARIKAVKLETAKPDEAVA